MSMSRRQMLLGTVTSLALTPSLSKVVVASPARAAMAAAGSVADYAKGWHGAEVQPYQRFYLDLLMYGAATVEQVTSAEGFSSFYIPVEHWTCAGSNL